MVMLYLDQMCEQGDCDKCNGGHAAPPECFGGSMCTCSCHKANQRNAEDERIRQILKEAWKNIW